MTKDVKNAFKALGDTVLLAIASDWTSLVDANEYYALASALDELEDSYNARIGK